MSRTDAEKYPSVLVDPNEPVEDVKNTKLLGPASLSQQPASELQTL